MNVEKLILNKKDHITQNTIEEIVAGVSFEGIPVVLTPYKSNTNILDYSLDLFSRTGDNFVRLTPSDFIKSREKLLSQILIVENPNLMEDLGYKKELEEIRSFGYNFISLCECEFIKDPESLALDKFYVNCKDEFVYISLFVLFKVYKIISIVTRDKLKTEIVCKVLKMDCKVFDPNETLRGGLTDIVIVVGIPLTLPSKKIIYLGVEPEGAKEIKVDYKKVSKYVYRIKDVLRSITRDVIKGKKKFNYDRFKNILN